MSSEYVGERKTKNVKRHKTRKTDISSVSKFCRALARAGFVVSPATVRKYIKEFCKEGLAPYEVCKDFKT
ncbi:MAG: hypothetical protein ACK416_01885 [Zestosphaera sp.]